MSWRIGIGLGTECLRLGPEGLDRLISIRPLRWPPGLGSWLGDEAIKDKWRYYIQGDKAMDRWSGGTLVIDPMTELWMVRFSSREQTSSD